MKQFRTRHRPSQAARWILPIVVLLAAVGLLSSLAAAQSTKRVVKETHSPSLGAVLAANNGLTLYTLSAERHGNFICKGSCLKIWFPLVVAAGVKPTGPVALGTVKRPDGRRQVTFRGLPLYTFDGDSKRGDAKGEGIRDVGTWHAARP